MSPAARDRRTRKSRRRTVRSLRHSAPRNRLFLEALEDRRLLATVNLCTLPGHIIGSNDDSFESYDVVVDGCNDAIVNGQHEFASLSVRNNSTLGHSATTTSTIHSMALTVAGSVIVDAGSSIDASGQGFRGGDPSNVVGFTNGNSRVGGSGLNAGGSHAGIGGQARSDGPPGQAYGDPTNPIEPGAGGGSSGNGAGGAGGGVVILSADSLILNGRIQANGGVGCCTNPTGGAGGSINLDVDTFSGGGTILANGGYGDSYGAAGAGGRVAVRYDSSSFTGTIQARGNTADQSSASYVGGAGTIFTKQRAQTWGDLKIDNGGNSGQRTPLDGGSFDSLTVRGGGYLDDTSGTMVTVSGTVVGNNGVIDIQQLQAGSLLLVNNATLPQPLTASPPSLVVEGSVSLANTSVELQTIFADSLDVGSNVTLSHPPTERGGLIGKLEINVAGTISVAPGSVLSGYARGFQGGRQNADLIGYTVGNTQSGGSGNVAGGSHGGRGGQMRSDGVPAVPYDDLYDPQEPGGGGGSRSFSTSGGVAGGGVVLIRAEALHLDGTIDVRGNAGIGVAGSAGGSVNVRVSSLSGSGSIDADGAEAPGTGGGGGGGGRVALYFDESTYTGSITARGGSGRAQAGGQIVDSASGGAGTIYTKSSANAFGDLKIDNGGRHGNTTPLTGGFFRTLNARRGGHLVVQSDMGLFVTGSMIANDATVDALRIRAGSLKVLNGATLPQPLDGPARSLVVDSLMTVTNTDLEMQTIVAGGLDIGSGVVISHPTTEAGGPIGKLDITVHGTMNVAAGAVLDGYAKGFRGGLYSGPGYTAGNTTVGGSERYNGGSHGGLGGGGASAATYDDPDNPVLPGGGGGGSGNSSGGHGGGVVIIKAGELLLDGTIDVSGGVGSGTLPPGGAGGSVNIQTFSFAGSGAISARGGAGLGGGGGGGGRIMICRNSHSYNGSRSAAGGIGVGGNPSGQAGSNIFRSYGPTCEAPVPPPIADPNGPYFVPQGNSVVLDGTNSLGLGTNRSDLFGRDVAIDGDRVIVGSMREDGLCPEDLYCDSGAAYIYERIGTDWVLQKRLTASDAAPGDQFGTSVALEGDTAVVAAHTDDDHGDNSGAVYVFQFDGTDWNEQAKLTASDGSDGDFFGLPVAIDKDTLVVGAYGNDDGGADAGSAYVFTRTSGVWTEQAKLTAGDPGAGDGFGFALGVHEDTVVVGAYLDDDGETNSGSAYVFHRTGTTWTQQAKLSSGDSDASDQFGVSVAIEGNTVVVGANGDDERDVNAGAAYLFERNGTTWSQQSKLTASDPGRSDVFGRSVSIADDTVLVGALGDDTAGGVNSGSAYVFHRDGSSWTEQTRLLAANAGTNDRMALELSNSGDTIVVSSYLHDGLDIDSGAAYIFRRDGTTWAQDAQLTQPGPTDNSIVSYEWDFDYDGLSFDVDATGPTPHFDASSLTDPATFNVALRARSVRDKANIGVTTVTITGDGGSPPPVASPDTFQGDEDSVLSVAAPGVLDNDNGTAPLRVAAFDSLSELGAIVVLGPNGDVTYDPTGTLTLQALPVGAVVIDEFEYSITDGSDRTSDPAAVAIEVTGRNDAPVAQPVSLSAHEDGPPVTSSFDADDIDSDDTPATLSYAITSAPSGGSVSNHGDGTFTFDPGNDFDDLAVGESREVSFGYKATDSHGASSNEGLIRITVSITGANDAPVAEDVSTSVEEDGDPITAAFDADDIDSDDGPATLTYEILTPILVEGAVVNNQNGTFTFDPHPGLDFQELAQGEIKNLDLLYRAVDSHDEPSNNATATIIVTGVNDGPTAEDVSIDAAEDGPTVVGTFDADDVDSDDDPGTLVYAITSLPAEGSVTNNNDGTFTFDPGDDFQDLGDGQTRQVTFNYTATDSHGEPSNAAAIMAAVTGVNDAPSLIAEEDPVVVSEGDYASNSGIFTDVDMGDIVTITASVGTVEQFGTQAGTWTWSFDTTDGPDESQTVIVTATDSNGAAATTSFVLTVNNVAPSLAANSSESPEFPPPVSLTVTEFTPVDLALSVTDPGDDTISQWEIDWGDGTIESYPGATSEITHTYRRPGTFQVTAFATDEDGIWPDPGPALLATVDVINDSEVPSQWCVTHTGDSGTGSLRWAIDNANSNGGPDVVCFEIPATDPGFVDVDSSLVGGDAAADAFVIQPDSALPHLSDTSGGTTIDGTTQSVFGGDTNPFGPEIVIDGTLAGASIDGVRIAASSDNRVVGLNIQNFTRFGVFITFGSSNNQVAGNYIGTDATGRATAGNSTAVQISEAAHNVIGTDGDGVNDSLEGNVLSGNAQRGVNLLGPGADYNIIAGNFIGTNAAGTAALGNGLDGVGADSGTAFPTGPQFNRIGTNGDGVSDEWERNIISGNGTAGASFGSGVLFIRNTEHNIVAGNYIGTDLTGETALPNARRGVDINLGGKSNVVGTNGDGIGDAAEGNLISGNTHVGVSINDSSSESNVVAGNFIGTNASGTAAVPNGSGVQISNGAHSNRIGSDANGVADQIERNLISGNLLDGVRLPNAHDNAITGNYIGTDVTGAAGLPNDRHGVWIDTASANTIGGTTPAARNVISGNGASGIQITDGSNGNPIRANSIHSNGGLGIDLAGDGVTPNDYGDADTGPNQLQNTPEITQAIPGATTRIIGSLHSVPDTTFVLDFYASTAADPSGFGEGERYLGSAPVTTNGSGDASFDEVLTGATLFAEFVTTTATDPVGNTSEFSAAIFANTPPVASPVSVDAQEDGAAITASFNADDVDSDDNPGTLTYAITSTPSEGSVVNNNDGTFTFDPGNEFQDLAQGETRQVTFGYTATDSHNSVSNTASVIVTVTGANDVPFVTAETPALVVNEGDSVVNSGTFGDIDLSDAVTINASAGTADQVGTNSGTWSWSLDATDGPDESQTVIITANDGTDTGSVEFQLTVNNVAPDFEAGSDETLLPAVAGGFSRTGIAFTDPGTDTWSGTVNFGDSAADFPLSIDQSTKAFDLSHTYTSEGTFTVTVTVDDGDPDGTHTDTFQVTVILNHPPGIDGQSFQVAEGQTAVGNLVASDADLPEDTLTFSITGNGPDDGKFAVTDEGELSFLAGPDFESPSDLGGTVGDNVYLVEVQVEDSHHEAATATISVTVTNVDPTTPVDADAAVNTVTEGAATDTTVGITASATDPLGTAVIYSLTDDADGRFVIHPGTGVVAVSNGALLDGPATYTITVQAGDGAGGTATGDFEVTVTNVAPNAADDTATTNEDQAIVIDVLAGDSDPAGAADPLTIAGATNGSHGSTTIDDQGTADPADDVVVYTPDAGFDGTDTFTYTIDDGDGGTDTAMVTVTVNNLVDLAGRVFDDRDNDGVFEPSDGDQGLSGVTVELFDQDSSALIDSLTTAPDGTYLFDANLQAGTYFLRQAQAGGYLDGKETAGDIGGTVDNTQDSVEILDIVVGAPGTTPDTDGYDFAELLPASLQGLVWEDWDDDGEVDFGELAIDGATITLNGTDDRGNAVDVSQSTDAQGIFEFIDLRPGTYMITETQPTSLAGEAMDFIDGQDVLGEVIELPPAVVLGDDGQVDPSEGDTFSEIELVPGAYGVNYNFGERVDGGQVQAGQAAGIGFWQNKNGQALIKSLNGGSSSTLLAGWLSETFPNMYGGVGWTDNTDVAATYKQLFKRNGKTSPGGPPKLDAQVLAVAIASYVTKESFVSVDFATSTSDAALVSGVESYGFTVTVGGLGSTTFNVGDSGAAFNVANHSDMRVIDLLLATDSLSVDGLLYDVDGSGDIDDEEELLRVLANDVFAAINEAGDN